MIDLTKGCNKCGSRGLVNFTEDDVKFTRCIKCGNVERIEKPKKIKKVASKKGKRK